ncbi:NAD-dependent epimerase/dehydratase family protein [Flavimarina sp. Hel_I_48]|uniref:NAD-dependent epimerase/dehydratase family protein n=1 Tax=Flavimarina sp. Hel_I_48 TaxID=1392488 RepID=UPI0004DF5D35|nr:NAD-dependent epimerase/dehydratase family protein [Flavimarina sp. Hel_I_48]
MAKTAIILGITGLTGSILAKQLFEDEDYEKVISFHRRASELSHPKFTEHVVNLFELKREKERFKADVVFCCIGTTQAKTEDKETYKAIDYGIPLDAAQLCKDNNISTFIAISAMGADAESRIFYNRTKGEMQRDIFKLSIPNIYFMQPALLAGDREETRTAEKIATKVFKILNPLLVGPLKKYKSIKPEKIAKTMRFVAKNGFADPLIESDKIQKIADEHA